MEFRSYLDKDGYLRDRSLLVHGPLQPGTLLTKVPTVAGMQLRFGTIIAVHNGQVDVMWNEWSMADTVIEHGQLRQALGIKSAAALKKERWEAKKRERAEVRRREEEATRDAPATGRTGTQ